MQDKSAAGGGFTLRVAASFNTTLNRTCAASRTGPVSYTLGLKRLRMRHQFYFVFILILISGIAHSATIEDLPCQNGCADDCIRFNQGTIFVQIESGAKLLHEGAIYDLSRVTSRYLRRHQKDAEVAGDIQVSTWSNGSINAEVTQTVIDTTCYWREPNGTYISAENCCGTNYRVKLRLSTPRGKHILNAIFESGC